MSKIFVSVLLIFSCLKIHAQKWQKSSIDLSISYVGSSPKIHEQLKNEFISNPFFENKFNYQEVKKATIDTPNYNYPGITFANLNYVMKRNTNFLFFRHVLFTSGINLNFSDRGNYEFSYKDSGVNHYDEVRGNFVEMKNGLGFNLGFSLLSKSFLQRIKFQAQILNSFSPFSMVKYSSANIHVVHYGNDTTTFHGGLPEYSKSPGKLMNNTQVKLGLRFNVDCTGNIFINYVTNYTIYKGKPDIKYTGFSQGIEFGINFLLSNEEKSLESGGAFW